MDVAVSGFDTRMRYRGSQPCGDKCFGGHWDGWMVWPTGRLQIWWEIPIQVSKWVSLSTKVFLERHAPSPRSLLHRRWVICYTWVSEQSKLWFGHPFSRCMAELLSRIWNLISLVSVNLNGKLCYIIPSWVRRPRSYRWPNVVFVLPKMQLQLLLWKYEVAVLGSGKSKRSIKLQSQPLWWARALFRRLVRQG